MTYNKYLINNMDFQYTSVMNAKEVGEYMAEFAELAEEQDKCSLVLLQRNVTIIDVLDDKEMELAYKYEVIYDMLGQPKGKLEKMSQIENALIDLHIIR